MYLESSILVSLFLFFYSLNWYFKIPIATTQAVFTSGTIHQRDDPNTVVVIDAGVVIMKSPPKKCYYPELFYIFEVDGYQYSGSTRLFHNTFDVLELSERYIETKTNTWTTIYYQIDNPIVSSLDQKNILAEPLILIVFSGISSIILMLMKFLN